jgi:hypothetical protein
MLEYMKEMMTQLGFSPWMICAFVFIMIWSNVWKFIALWKAGRKNSLSWFIILALVNTVGILEILYIFVFSKMKTVESEKPVGTKPKRKKR